LKMTFQNTQTTLEIMKHFIETKLLA
jgi:hypothetical protein